MSSNELGICTQCKLPITKQGTMICTKCRIMAEEKFSMLIGDHDPKAIKPSFKIARLAPSKVSKKDAD